MNALIASFTMVFVGELGDKSQLLAMAFLCRFRAWQVMLGVTLATLLNQSIAVAVGTVLASVIPMNAVRIAAGISFLLFGLLTLRGEKEEAESKHESRFGPVLTVVLTFFLAEMGDKTQLATLALAADLRSPAAVLAGATAGMVLADALAVLLGEYICKRVSPRIVHLVSACVFLVFGCITLYQALG